MAARHTGTVLGKMPARSAGFTDRTLTGDRGPGGRDSNRYSPPRAITSPGSTRNSGRKRVCFVASLEVSLSLPRVQLIVRGLPGVCWRGRSALCGGGEGGGPGSARRRCQWWSLVGSLLVQPGKEQKYNIKKRGNLHLKVSQPIASVAESAD